MLAAVVAATVVQAVSVAMVLPAAPGGRHLRWASAVPGALVAEVERVETEARLATVRQLGRPR